MSLLAIADLTLLDIGLPQATTFVSVFFMVDGQGTVAALDAVAATRP